MSEVGQHIAQRVAESPGVCEEQVVELHGEAQCRAHDRADQQPWE